MENTEIKCVSSVDGEIYIMKLSDVINDIDISWEDFTSYSAQKSEDIIINGIPCEIFFHHGWYCGYVKLESLYPDVPDNITDIIKKKPHGDYTAHHGFDCAHYNDIRLTEILMNIPILDSATFKTRGFVFHELSDITREINKYMENPDAY